MTTSPNGRVRRYLISTLKGGPGKTTTTFLLALAWARRGLRVVAVDADTRSQTLTAWKRRAEAAGFKVPFTVLTWRGLDQDGDLVRFCDAAEREHSPAIMLVDTGGEHPDVFMSGCLWAERLISPVGPMGPELDRMHQTKDAAAVIDSRKKDGILMSALLTRCPKPGHGRAKEARDFLTAEPTEEDRDALGLHVMATEISRNFAYVDGYAVVPDDVGEYADLAAELDGELADAGVVA